jgi:hypothetical protein
MTRPASVLGRAIARGRVAYFALFFGACAAICPTALLWPPAAVFASVCLFAIAGGVAWDLVVLAGLAIDSVRRRRQRPPIFVGIDYGAGEDKWFETRPGAEPYRSFDERRLLARGDPAAAARQVAGALATRLGVVTGVGVITVVVALASLPVSSYRHTPRHYVSPSFAEVHSDCSAINFVTWRWLRANPGRDCPTVEDMKADLNLDESFSAQDPWGSRYEIRCFDDYDYDVACTSPGPDRKPGTSDDIVIPGAHPDRILRSP